MPEAGDDEQRDGLEVLVVDLLDLKSSSAVDVTLTSAVDLSMIAYRVTPSCAGNDEITEAVRALRSRSRLAGGFVASGWQDIWDYQANPTPENEAAERRAFSLEAIRDQYVTGVEDETVLAPDTWTLDHAHLSRPGNAEVQLRLFRDYVTNPPLYPALHEWLRNRQIPVLATWGKHDPFLGPDGARAFARDTENAEVHLLEGGHFLLESAGDEVVELMLDFLARRLPAA